MSKAKKYSRWFMFAGWLFLAIFALLTDTEQHWREMFAVACFLLAANNAFDGGKG